MSSENLSVDRESRLLQESRDIPLGQLEIDKILSEKSIVTLLLLIKERHGLEKGDLFGGDRSKNGFANRTIWTEMRLIQVALLRLEGYNPTTIDVALEDELGREENAYKEGITTALTFQNFSEKAKALMQKNNFVRHKIGILKPPHIEGRREEDQISKKITELENETGFKREDLFQVFQFSDKKPTKAKHNNANYLKLDASRDTVWSLETGIDILHSVLVKKIDRNIVAGQLDIKPNDIGIILSRVLSGKAKEKLLRVGKQPWTEEEKKDVALMLSKTKDGLTYRDVAKKYGLKLKAARSRIYREGERLLKTTYKNEEHFNPLAAFLAFYGGHDIKTARKKALEIRARGMNTTQ